MKTSRLLGIVPLLYQKLRDTHCHHTCQLIYNLVTNLKIRI